MKGERPRQPHMAEIYDDATAVGRTDVTDLIETVIARLPAERRLYPELYAHEVTRALIDAGIIDGGVYTGVES